MDESENFFQREGNAIKNMCCGCVLVVVCIIVIFWNETNLVVAQATADVMMDAMVVRDCAVNPSMSGKLVFASCSVKAPEIAGHLPEPLRDFVGSYRGASLDWSTEIYQWEESTEKNCQKDNVGGQTCHTSYNYDTRWVSGPISSNSFHEPRGHENTGHFPTNLGNGGSGGYKVPEYSVSLSNGEGGEAFALDTNLQDQLPVSGPAISNPEQNPTFEPWHGGAIQSRNLRVEDGYLTTGYNVGDIRIAVKGRTATSATVCAKQGDGGSGGVKLGPWPPQQFDIWGRETHNLEYLRRGTYTLPKFVQNIKDENKIIAWIVRIIGLVVMMCAFSMIFSPLSVMADLLRVLNYCTCCLGSILDSASQAVISAVSCVSGCCCFTFIFCLAWCFANPTYAILGVGFILLLVAAAAAFHFTRHKSDAREAVVDTPYLKLGEGHAIVAAA